MAITHDERLRQRFQYADEATPGTAETTGFKIPSLMSMRLGIAMDGNLVVQPEGTPYPAEVVVGDEWSTLEFPEVPISFNEAHLLPVALGLVSATPTQIGATPGYKWEGDITQTLPTTLPPVFTLEQDGLRPRRVTYGTVTAATFTFTRRQATQAGSGIARALSDNVTFTGSGAALPAKVLIPKKTSITMDPTAAAIGTTKLTSNYGSTISMADFFGPVFPMDDTSSSFKDTIRMRAPINVTLRTEAAAQGMGILTNYRAGDRLYFQWTNVGANIGASADYTWMMQLCCQVTDAGAFDEETGLVIRPWTLTAVHDAAWTADLGSGAASGGRIGHMRIVNTQTAL